MANTKPTPQSLERFEARAWQNIGIAAIDSTHPFRNLTLATVNLAGQPQARIVVLRGATMEERTLEFHTDIRSTKWTELVANPRATVLGYNSTDRLQIRLTGTTQLHTPDSIKNQQRWDSLSTWSRQTYCGAPPGEELNAPDSKLIQTKPPTEVETQSGQKYFGVIYFTAETLDCFQHHRGHLTRADYTYKHDGDLQSCKWVAA